MTVFSARGPQKKLSTNQTLLKTDPNHSVFNSKTERDYRIVYFSCKGQVQNFIDFNKRRFKNKKMG